MNVDHPVIQARHTYVGDIRQKRVLRLDGQLRSESPGLPVLPVPIPEL